MIAKVITLMNMPQSVKAAQRCIDSGAGYGVHVQNFNAVTPKTVDQFVYNEQIDTRFFKEKYSRFKNALAAFSSHYSLWKESYQTQQNYLILEHDAVFVGDIPTFLRGDIVNLGEPSYGRVETPGKLGEGPLCSKPFLPGAHGYYITPKGAWDLIRRAKIKAKPTDVYIHQDDFEITEFYPWPIQARDTFTTIQREEGIQAKFSYLKTGKMDILNVR
jgi:GR25 family glycosyltransferase involved in LPS biosynthesis